MRDLPSLPSKFRLKGNTASSRAYREVECLEAKLGAMMAARKFLDSKTLSH